MKKQKYRAWPVVKRLIRDIKRGDSRQIGRVILHAVCGGLYPFLAVFLPKLAIGILEREERTPWRRWFRLWPSIF